MSVFLSHAFNDPNDPWYYVIGVIALLLIFGALAAYIIIGNKRKKQKADSISSEQSEQPQSNEEMQENIDTEANEQPSTGAESDIQSPADE